MKLNHKFQPCALVPYAALDDNIDLILSRKGECTTSDGILCSVFVEEVVHVLSKQGEEIINDMYGMTQMKYLSIWYERCGEHFNSLELLQLKLIKK